VCRELLRAEASGLVVDFEAAYGARGYPKERDFIIHELDMQGLRSSTKDVPYTDTLADVIVLREAKRERGWTKRAKAYRGVL